MEIITRQEARSQGLKLYFSGRLCKHNHMCERRTSNGTCEECGRIKAKARFETSKDKMLSSSQAWKKNNPDRIKSYNHAWTLANPEARKFHHAKRRAVKLQRTPPWADLKKIKVFYLACPKGYHVDHYYPLQGEICSGLHVLENLRHIPANENLSKKNKMPEAFYS